MKHIREYAILLAVIVGVGLYLALSSSDGVHYELPRLASLSTQNVDALRIVKGNRSLTLRQTNGSWSVPDKGYEAEGEKVREMLRKAADPRITALVSEAGNYARYHLGEARRIEVKVLCDGEAVRKLYLGKSAGQVQNTYVRLPGDQNVYMAEKDLRGAFDTTAEKLRDKTVFRLDPAKASALRVSGQNATRRLSRVDTSSSGGNATKGADWRTEQGETVRSEPVEDLLRTLESLRCRKYRQDLSRNGTRYTIAVQANATHRLRLYVPEKERPGAYEAASSQVSDPFELPGYLGQEVISSVKKLLQGTTGKSGSE
jgi:hypothetical protein